MQIVFGDGLVLLLEWDETPEEGENGVIAHQAVIRARGEEVGHFVIVQARGTGLTFRAMKCGGTIRPVETLAEVREVVGL